MNTAIDITRIKVKIIAWSTLSSPEQRNVLRRPAQENAAELMEKTRTIINEVRARGDAALREITQRYDGALLQSLQVTSEEFAAAEGVLSNAQRAALQRAIANVRCFHEAQQGAPLRVETSPGVVCERM